MARLTAAQRNALPDSDFAGPNRTYPDNDANHARNAQSRAAQFASPALKAKIAKKVHAKYPKIGKTNDRTKAIQALEAKREGESVRVERTEKRDAADTKMPGPSSKLVPGLAEPRSLGSGQMRASAPPLRGGHPIADPRALGSGNLDEGRAPAPRGGGGIPDPRSLGA